MLGLGSLLCLVSIGGMGQRHFQQLQIMHLDILTSAEACQLLLTFILHCHHPTFSQQIFSKQWQHCDRQSPGYRSMQH